MLKTLWTHKKIRSKVLIDVTTCMDLIKIMLSKRRQSGRNTNRRIPFIWSAQKWLVAQCWGEGWDVTVNQRKTSFRRDVYDLKLDCGVVLQVYTYTKIQRTAHLKQINVWHIDYISKSIGNSPEPPKKYHLRTKALEAQQLWKKIQKKNTEKIGTWIAFSPTINFLLDSCLIVFSAGNGDTELYVNTLKLLRRDWISKVLRWNPIFNTKVNYLMFSENTKVFLTYCAVIMDEKSF